MRVFGILCFVFCMAVMSVLDDTGYSMVDSGYSVLVNRYWMLVPGSRTLYCISLEEPEARGRIIC